MKKQRMKKQKINYLDLIPKLNQDIELEKDDTGNTVILVHNKGVFNRIAQKLFKKPEVTNVHLDNYGSFILPLIDGKLSVAELAELQKEHFGDAVEPLYPRFVKYIQVLEGCGFITTNN